MNSIRESHLSSLTFEVNAKFWVMSWLWVIIVGGVSGWLASVITGSSNGALLNILLGIPGGVVGF